ncbi:hypothetical protein [Paracoccus marinaquae]|uniref:hypothetical protein n=1 Tax=Paracoccus marinaquae TaxID=2841926 RepID=UPI002091750C|nr:hypothetical protein [Paracoccus marinaquae]
MPDRPLFLERASFRRRRLGDAARVLPVVSALLVLLPVWWMPRLISFAAGAAWFFGLWAALILAVWALHRALLRAEAVTLRAEAAVVEAARERAAAQAAETGDTAARDSHGAF